MYRFDVAGDDFKRLQKMLVWTGAPGTKNPEEVSFVSSEKGIFIWVDNISCEALFKVHEPIDDYGVRRVKWGEWKQIVSAVKTNSNVHFKVKKTSIDVEIGATKKSMAATAIEETPTITVVDASEIAADKVYFNDEAMEPIKIGLSAKTAIASLTPFICKGDKGGLFSIFFSKAVVFNLGIEIDGTFTQGAARIPVESGGGVYGWEWQGNFMLSAVDFMCKFKPYESPSIDWMDAVAATTPSSAIGSIDLPEKKTDRARLIRDINMMKQGSAGFQFDGLKICPTQKNVTNDGKRVTIAYQDTTIDLLRSDLVLVLKNSPSKLYVYSILNDNNVPKGALFTHHSNDRWTSLAGVIN